MIWNKKGTHIQSQRCAHFRLLLPQGQTHEKTQQKVWPQDPRADPLAHLSHTGPYSFFCCESPPIPAQLSAAPMAFLLPLLPLGFTAEKGACLAGGGRCCLNSLWSIHYLPPNYMASIAVVLWEHCITLISKGMCQDERVPLCLLSAVENGQEGGGRSGVFIMAREGRHSGCTWAQPGPAAIFPANKYTLCSRMVMDWELPSLKSCTTAEVWAWVARLHATWLLLGSNPP